MTIMVMKFVDDHMARFQRQLYELLRIRSISTQPECAPLVEEAAQWLAADMRRIGLQHVEVVPTEGHPVVYGDWLKAGENAPTVLVYGHYDVQPAVMNDGWKNEPFEPVERDGYMYARGVSDDKGQVFAHLKAVEALLATEKRLPINIKFLIEGEEEIGSVHLGLFIQRNLSRLSADVCVISDSGMPAPEQPAIVYALRGMVALEIVVSGPEQDLHSGVYGGAVHNPLQALAEMIAKLHKPDGTVAVPGFYDDVLPLADDERAELDKNGWSEKAWRATTGIPHSWGEMDYAIHERLGARPTLEINGMAGGYYDLGFKSVIPAQAIAKLSCRLVANQKPSHIAELLQDYIEAITPPTVRVEIHHQQDSCAPAFVDIHTPAMAAAVAAYEKGWGAHPVFMREGGSIPVVTDFQEALGAAVILMGFSLNSDGAHGPNEHFSVEMFRKGIITAAHFYQEMAKKRG